MNNKYIAKCVLKVAKNLIASDESWEKVKSPLLKELKKHFKGITEKVFMWLMSRIITVL